MKIAIASGKGGTGKTTLSCAMAFAIDGPVRLLDCDVEEPNSHFFVHPAIESAEEVYSLVPEVDPEKCTNCGACGRVCRFSAIVPLVKKTLVFSELCHSCGGCARICPSGAITEVRKRIGTIETGRRDHVEFISGQLDVGQAMSPPVIRAVLNRASEDGLTIVDSPPGTACPFVTAVKGCDAVILVTEPTPFGRHDLGLAVETVRELGVPFGVVVNRSTAEENLISEYCRKENIPLLLQIPEDRRVAQAYSRGRLLTDVMPELRDALRSLPQQLEELA
ncbi:MAG: ATP-binding protein [Pontiellaceae bacterium]|nr:ATP-binding protein [Pontiellaceae bacterium]MBN2783317.1 ATP-binding protein [Pontiellaceae bacterium]